MSAVTAVSVVMPTFDHARFIGRAISSLIAQNFGEWELVVVDDGSSDDTTKVVKGFLGDRRIRYERLATNGGLGAALNRGLALSSADLVAYLPSDDVYYADHLASLVSCFDDDGVVFAFSGVHHHYNPGSGAAHRAPGQIEGYPLQLVQVMHRRTEDRWVEREELVTDDLGRMLWDRVRGTGRSQASGQVTCEWVDHPDQLHKVLLEPEDGGLNTFRDRYRVTHPLRFHSSAGNPFDEVAQYAHYRDRPASPPAQDALRILLVGELSYNADRILALEERGHRLYGLWMERPFGYNAVGPLPFGHVEDLPRDNWKEAVRRVRPDVIYALLNWKAVPFAHRVLSAAVDIPFVWHFKEGPFFSLANGHWAELAELYERADGIIHTSPEMGQWLTAAIPALADRDVPSLVLDGDLPKRDWFEAERSPLLSDQDGEIHTVMAGRPLGLRPSDVATLAAASVHLHVYGEINRAGVWRQWTREAQELAPHHLHLHSHVEQADWVEEFSRYDAGWLHFLTSENQGDLRRANWDDLNYPARLATLAVSGVPVLQRDNAGSIFATQSLARDLDIGLFFTEMSDLARQLRDTARMERLRENVWRQREAFTFDAHADRLVQFFRTVASSRAANSAASRTNGDD